ncbi:MAG: hypothetical protein ACLR13_01805 [Acutalibacteraceae bacterium]
MFPCCCKLFYRERRLSYESRFLNENKEEQKTEQTPTQTENKETAPQAVPANAVEEKKAVQEDEEEVSSQVSSISKQLSSINNRSNKQIIHIIHHIRHSSHMEMGSSMDSLGKVSAITTSNKISTGKDNVLLINRHTTSSRIKEISSSLFILMVNHNILCIRSQIQGAMVLQLPPWF